MNHCIPLSSLLHDTTNNHHTWTISPIHLSHRVSHRLIYAAIFGVMSDLFFNFALHGAGGYCSSSSTVNQYEHAFCDVGKKE